MATTRVEMQPLLENVSEVRRQQESTNNNRGVGSGGARVDISPPDSRCTRILSVATLVFIVFVYFWLILYQLIMAVHKKEIWKICVLSLGLALQVSVPKLSNFSFKLDFSFSFCHFQGNTLLVISHLTYTLRKVF